MEPTMRPAAHDRQEVDLDRLHDALRALASPVRLRLLYSLRIPQKLGDVRIPAPDERGGLRAERMLTRSTVQEHLAVLEGLGLVQHVPGDEAFVVNRQKVVSILNDLGALARIKPLVDLDVGRTVPSHAPSPGAIPEGPKLILVGGPEEGSAFALRGDGPWTVGRGEGCEVRLTFDPHVSRAQVVLARDSEGLFLAEAMAGATNAALLDFQELAPGHPQALWPGSVLSVGSSRLVFKAV